MSILDAPSHAPRTEPSPGRTLRRRRPLPGSRAVVGGLLVALAAVVSFTAAAQHDAGRGRPYVVARHDLAPGERLAPEDLAVVRVDLPPALAAGAFGSPGDVVGAVTTGPVAEGSLVQAGGLVPAADAPAAAELSFALDADRAVGGTLRAGERVDVLVTYGSGTTATTKEVAGAATVVAVGRDEDRFGSSPRQVLRLSLTGSGTAIGLANAVRAGEVTIVRTPPRAGR